MNSHNMKNSSMIQFQVINVRLYITGNILITYRHLKWNFLCWHTLIFIAVSVAYLVVFNYFFSNWKILFLFWRSFYVANNLMLETRKINVLLNYVFKHVCNFYTKMILNGHKNNQIILYFYHKNGKLKKLCLLETSQF